MQVFRGVPRPSPQTPSACALTIGNFDGVHRGHRAGDLSEEDVAGDITDLLGGDLRLDLPRLAMLKCMAKRFLSFKRPDTQHVQKNYLPLAASLL